MVAGATQKERKPDSSHPRTGSSNPVPSSGESDELPTTASRGPKAGGASQRWRPWCGAVLPLQGPFALTLTFALPIRLLCLDPTQEWLSPNRDLRQDPQERQAGPICGSTKFRLVVSMKTARSARLRLHARRGGACSADRSWSASPSTSSNPACSSGESTNHQFLGGEAASGVCQRTGGGFDMLQRDALIPDPR